MNDARRSLRPARPQAVGTRGLTPKSNQQPGRIPLRAGARGLASRNETQRRGCRAIIKAKYVR